MAAGMHRDRPYYDDTFLNPIMLDKIGGDQE